MKLKAGSDLFKYESAYWTDDQTLNTDSTTAGINDDIDAKLPAFNSAPIQVLKICYKTLTNCYEYDLGTTYSSARELFNSGFQRSNNLGGGSRTVSEAKKDFTDLFLPSDDAKYSYFWDGGSGTACTMQLPGINTQCRGNNWARIGYCVNHPRQACTNQDRDDADAAVGIGLKTQNWPKNVNAPFGEYFIHGVGNSGVQERQHQAWLFSIPKGTFNNDFAVEIEQQSIWRLHFILIYTTTIFNFNFYRDS